MSARFTEYESAFNHAATQATLLQMPMVIRGVKEFGKAGFNVNIKSNDGSDYLAETVSPNQPLITPKERT